MFVTDLIICKDLNEMVWTEVSVVKDEVSSVLQGASGQQQQLVLRRVRYQVMYLHIVAC